MADRITKDERAFLWLGPDDDDYDKLTDRVQELVDKYAVKEWERITSHLREFLPEWNYPPHVVSAICLELEARRDQKENA